MAKQRKIHRTNQVDSVRPLLYFAPARIIFLLDARCRIIAMQRNHPKLLFSATLRKVVFATHSNYCKLFTSLNLMEISGNNQLQSLYENACEKMLLSASDEA